MKLQDYLDENAERTYAAGVWDCSKYVVLWTAQHAPRAAHKAISMLVDAGYNNVNNEADFFKVRDELGIRCPKSFVWCFHNAMPDLVKLPLRPQPGDIVVREEGLACGIIGKDFQVIYLAPKKGFIKRPLDKHDAFMRAVA